MIFKNREDAGKKLADALEPLRNENPVLLALPRGGVPIAAEVAEQWGAPLDVLIVRKIGAPDNPEFGIGAMAEDGSYWLNGEAISVLGVSQDQLREVIRKESAEVHRRVEAFRQGRRLVDLSDRTVVLIDDGLATGSSAKAAISMVKAAGAKEIVLATPVCASETAKEISQSVDRVVCLESPARFVAVGLWYEDFSQTSDEEVRALLKRHSPREPMAETASAQNRQNSEEITLSEAGIRLKGLLTVPSGAKGLIIFAHGAGSSRQSPRNQSVANVLNKSGMATLLMDLLTEEEARDRRKVFDIPLLADRLLLAMDWANQRRDLQALPIGLFGASTGAGAALVAAAQAEPSVEAVVSRGGRPDLAADSLQLVRAPTLLIVGGDDHPVIEMNEEAAAQLPDARVSIVPGATHLFEEPGTLDEVSLQARDWFLTHLGRRTRQVA